MKVTKQELKELIDLYEKMNMAQSPAYLLSTLQTPDYFEKCRDDVCNYMDKLAKKYGYFRKRKSYYIDDKTGEITHLITKKVFNG